MAPHRCPAKGCTSAVTQDHLACRKHWVKLPWRMRTNITEAWRNRDSVAHLAAISAAFDFYSTHDVDAEPESHGGHTTTTVNPDGPSYSPWEGSASDIGSSTGGE